jgi:GGDEF domain-containing protein
MRSALRTEDKLARIGGDEFALLVPRAESVGDVSIVAEKIPADGRREPDVKRRLSSLAARFRRAALFPQVFSSLA